MQQECSAVPGSWMIGSTWLIIRTVEMVLDAQIRREEKALKLPAGRCRQDILSHGFGGVYKPYDPSSTEKPPPYYGDSERRALMQPGNVLLEVALGPV